MMFTYISRNAEFDVFEDYDATLLVRLEWPCSKCFRRFATGCYAESVLNDPNNWEQCYREVLFDQL